MINVGLGFVAFGALLWMYQKLVTPSAAGRLVATARIVGYKQFRTDKTISDNKIFRGRNFLWHRVMEFTHPQTGQVLQLYSNPGVVNPEPIGTPIEISFNPDKINPVSDSVWIQGGMRAVQAVAQTSLVTGVAVFVVLLFVPKTSPLQLVAIIPAFATVFVAAYLNAWRRPNQ